MIHLVIEKFVSKIWLTEYGTRALGCREIVDTFSCITDLSRTTKVEYNDSNIVIYNRLVKLIFIVHIIHLF